MESEVKKQFGIFVGFYNRVNGTKLSVKKAAQLREIVDLFTMYSSGLKENHIVYIQPKMSNGTIPSTKLKSYSLLNIPKVDKEVYDFLQRNPGSARFEIAYGLNRRISTICGAINRLEKNNLVMVVGVTTDLETNREVESLGVCHE